MCERAKEGGRQRDREGGERKMEERQAQSVQINEGPAVCAQRQPCCSTRSELRSSHCHGTCCSLWAQLRNHHQICSCH